MRAWDLQHGRRDGLPGQLHRLHAWSLQPNLRRELSDDLRQLRGGHVRDGQRVLCREQLLPLLAWLLFGRDGGDGGGDLRRLQRGRSKTMLDIGLRHCHVSSHQCLLS